MTKKTLLLSSSPQGFGLKASQHLVEDFETRAVFFFLVFLVFLALSVWFRVTTVSSVGLSVSGKSHLPGKNKLCRSSNWP